MGPETAFHELIARVRGGDDRAAAELVAKYGAAVRRIVRVRLAGQQALRRVFDSMDVCQSVMASFFLRVALGQYDLDTPDSLLKLLATMAHNKVIDQARRQKAQQRDPARIDPGDPNEQAVAAATPSHHAEVRELLDRFRSGLTGEERRLVDLRAEGHTWDEIASAFGGTPDAVRVRVARIAGRAARELGLDE